MVLLGYDPLNCVRKIGPRSPGQYNGLKGEIQENQCEPNDIGGMQFAARHPVVSEARNEENEGRTILGQNEILRIMNAIESNDANHRRPQQ